MLDGADIPVNYAAILQANVSLKDDVDRMVALNAELTTQLKDTRDELVEEVKSRVELSDDLDELYVATMKFHITYKIMAMKLKTTQDMLASLRRRRRRKVVR
jgi:uncharacterized protein YukE